MTLRARTRAFLLATSAIYIIVGVISLRSALQLINSERWVRHTHEVLDALQTVLVDVNQAESLTRGYVLTGSDAFLKDLAEVEQRVPKQLDTVAGLTVDNPVQQGNLQNLRSLVTQRLQLLQQAVETRRQQGGPSASLIALILQGHGAMGEVSLAVQAMSDEENRLLAVRNERPGTPPPSASSDGHPPRCSACRPRRP